MAKPYFVTSEERMGYLGITGAGYLCMTKDKNAKCSLLHETHHGNSFFTVDGGSFSGFYVGLAISFDNVLSVVRDWNFARYMLLEANGKLILTNTVNKNRFEWRLDKDSMVTVASDAKAARFDACENYKRVEKTGWRFVKRYDKGVKVKESVAKAFKLVDEVKDQVIVSPFFHVFSESLLSGRL